MKLNCQGNKTHSSRKFKTKVLWFWMHAHVHVCFVQKHKWIDLNSNFWHPVQELKTVAKWGVVALTVNLQFLFLWNEVLPSFQNTSENCNTIRYVFHEQNSRWLIFRKFISCELDPVVWKQFCTKVSLNKYVYTVYNHDQYKLGKGLKIFKITFPMK